MRLETKVRTYSCCHDRVLTQNEWMDNPVRLSELMSISALGEGGGARNRPNRCCSGRAEKERTSTLPNLQTRAVYSLEKHSILTHYLPTTHLCS
jgi:hypothetical protein